MEPVLDARKFSGRYELTHLVARGGMAQVYRAHDELLDRTVALKVLFPELSVDQTFVERFSREAQSAAKLSHPNIVPVFDWGEDGGTYFIVMEFIDGHPLSDEIREHGQIEPTRAATIASSVAAALDYAHRRGVVHRDIKPGNVLITEEGQVKVTDFGIARAVNTEESLTQVGSVMGTATYFSPEQAEGRVVDSRSDLYSLGIVLYEMLVGRPPFTGDSPVAVASKHVREVAPMPRLFLATIPVGIEAVTMKAIAKRPEDRYQDAEEFREDLLRYVSGVPVLAPDPEAAHASDVEATTTMAAINRTQTIPIFSGPRTDLVSSRRRRRGPGVWGVVAVALVVAALAAGGVVLATKSGKGGSISVPNVVGLSLSRAKTQLADAGLKVGTVTSVTSVKPAGQVLSTNPAVGLAVAKGASVDLTVSNGSGALLVPLPSVVGKLLADAEATLTKAGFQVSVTTSSVAPTQDAPANTVLSQNPSSATAPKGATIALTVVGTPTVSYVPTLVGQQSSQASALLSQAGLSLGSETQACSNSYGSGIIISSTPSAGQGATPGSAVGVTVSSGPCQVTVPAYSGQTVGAYESALAGLNLTPSGGANCSQTSTVIGTSPAPGTSVQSGSTVVLTCQPPTTTSSTTSTTVKTTTTG
jgi:serine/threonine-protein kinase